MFAQVLHSTIVIIIPNYFVKCNIDEMCGFVHCQCTGWLAMLDNAQGST